MRHRAERLAQRRLRGSWPAALRNVYSDALPECFAAGGGGELSGTL